MTFPENLRSPAAESPPNVNPATPPGWGSVEEISYFSSDSDSEDDERGSWLKRGKAPTVAIRALSKAVMNLPNRNQVSVFAAKNKKVVNRPQPLYVAAALSAVVTPSAPPELKDLPQQYPCPAVSPQTPSRRSEPPGGRNGVIFPTSFNYARLVSESKFHRPTPCPSGRKWLDEDPFGTPNSDSLSTPRSGPRSNDLILHPPLSISSTSRGCETPHRGDQNTPSTGFVRSRSRSLIQAAHSRLGVALGLPSNKL